MGPETGKIIGARRTAFFGGSFDPPHIGHLAIARAARELLYLDEVLFVPVGRQPLKKGLSASYQDRVEMTRLAIADEHGFSVSLLDAPHDDAAPNYTAETLEALAHTLPHGSTLFFLMGADSFLALNRWHRGADIPFLAELVVASRPRETLQPLDAHLPDGLKLVSFTPESFQNDRLERWQLADNHGRTATLYLLPELHYDVSATALRTAIHSGKPLIPPAVLTYIRSHGLYA
jgi:nicotinate-nucleotide adenylyltransferase